MYIGAIQEERFEYKGYPCVILMQAMGFRTGYVGLPKDNMLYGRHYDDIDVSCHGCLTYSKDHLYGQEDKDLWWIGFDTGHWGDGYSYEEAIELFKDYPKVIGQIQIYKNCSLFEPVFPARSLDYCKNECKKIVDQIEELGE